jgi:hypothetical protein
MSGELGKGTGKPRDKRRGSGREWSSGQLTGTARQRRRCYACDCDVQEEKWAARFAVGDCCFQLEAGIVTALPLLTSAKHGDPNDITQPRRAWNLL